MIYKFIDDNNSEITVNSLSSLQALIDSDTINEKTKVKAGLRGKWTTASEIDGLVFTSEEIKENPEETVAPQGDIKSFITGEEKQEQRIDKDETVKAKEIIEDEINFNDDQISDEINEVDEIKTEEVIDNKKEEEQPDEENETEEKQPDEENETEEENIDKTYNDENVVSLNFFQAIQTCLKKYFTIKGRASRSEYWYFQLLFTPLALYTGVWSDPVSKGMMDPPPFYLISLLIVILLFVPAITSQIRRFHDRDKSGWFILINLIPFVGWIIVLVILIDRGTLGKNRFGDYPLKINNEK